MEWLREYRQFTQEAEPLPFVGRFAPSSSAEEVAHDLSETLGVSIKVRLQSSTRDDLLRNLIETAELAGVLVLRNGVVGNNTHRPLNVEEFRGFAYCDQFAPVIFINGRDARAAQVFTLVHELAHIWVNESGLSNPDFQKSAREHSNQVERFCDSVAAETLVPERDFLAEWKLSSPVSTNIRRLAGYFKVSNIVVLRRANELGKISRKQFLDEYAMTLSQARTSSPGGDGRRNVLTRNSSTFTRTLIEAVLTGHTTEKEAAALLSLKVPSFDRFVRWFTEVERV
jgi:Zn-dependent peptidase ImmA (M78 family)